MSKTYKHNKFTPSVHICIKGIGKFRFILKAIRKLSKIWKMIKEKGVEEMHITVDYIDHGKIYDTYEQLLSKRSDEINRLDEIIMTRNRTIAKNEYDIKELKEKETEWNASR